MTDDPLPTQKSTNNFFRFLNYVKPYKWYIVLGAIGGIAKFSVPLLVPELIRFLIDDVYLNEALSNPEKTQQMLTMVFATAGIFIFFWAPLTFMRHYYAGKAGHRSVFDLRYHLYQRILRMPPSFFDRNQSGSIVSRLISDIELTQNLVGTALTNVWMDLFALMFILFFLIRINLEITLVALVTFPIYLYLFRTLRTKIQSATHVVQEEMAVMSGNAQEKISGSRVVHAFVQEQNEYKHFHRDLENVFSNNMYRIRLQSFNMMLTGIIVHTAPLIVLLYGGYRVIDGGLSIGELIAVTLYLRPLYTPLERFSELNVVFSNSLAALDRVFEMMDTQPDVEERPNAITKNEIDGRVTFEDVEFAYRSIIGGAPEKVIHGISFDVKPGKRVALVGPSGSGKSTIMSLIPRFYDVDRGTIRVDNIDIRDYTIKSLRQHVGIVLQTPILFSGSVIDNIRYGNPDATMEEIVDAAKAANAYDFIMNLPDGFYSEVGEGGAFLSGGQRQRVTIARAYLKDPKILILDEATSSLDAESEKLIQSALERLMQGRTTFIIAHRPSTIENADLIFVLENGRITEAGTRDELVEIDGLYHKLFA
jgi:subfamily B ATP-binding cassette protein MsbA